MKRRNFLIGNHAPKGKRIEIISSDIVSPVSLNLEGLSISQAGGEMKVQSQSKDKKIEIPSDTEMILAEETKKVKSWRNKQSLKVDGEYYAEGDLWYYERKGRNE